jgi:proteasome assembly chaperone (PAC2) family protein
VGWSEDAGCLGSKIIDYLNKELDCQEFCEIEPEEFFPMGGVSVERDVAHFPESKFYCCPKRNLIVFRSSVPNLEWHKFLSSVLNVVQDCCRLKEIYTIGGMVSTTAHTMPRVLLAIANSVQMKKILSSYDLASDRNYETLPGQRPTMNSYLLWLAKQRNIVGANLWVPVPFYLMQVQDPAASKTIIDFLNLRLDLGIDFTGLDEEVALQDKKIAEVTERFPEIAGYITQLESNLSLTEDESNKLAEVIEDYLKR